MSKNTPQPRKHHYVPAYYLRGFSLNGAGLHRLDRDTGRIFGAQIKDLAAERDFHILDGEDVPDRQAVEKALSEIEGRFSRFQFEILASGIRNPEVLSMIVGFLSMMRMRVPAVKEYLADLTGSIQQSAFEHLVREGKIEIPVELAGIATVADLRVKTTNTALMQFMFQLAFDVDVMKILLGMSATLLHAPFGARFVTSDQPVSIFHPHPPASMGVGLITPGVELALPLSSRFALVLTQRPGRPENRDATSGEVDEINRRTFLMASSYVFAGENIEEFTPLVEKYRNEKYGFQYDPTSFRAGPAWLARVRPIGPAQ